MLNIEVRDLRLVLALAEGRTTARAARSLHLSQPAVSRALLAVEHRLGVPLFERSARGLAPTAAGDLLLEGARRLLVDLGDLEHRVRAPAAPPARLRIVCECYTAYHWLPSALAGLRRSFPDLEVVLAVEHTADPVAALQSGKIDAALLTTASAPAPLVARPLFHDEIVFVVARSHPLASRIAVTADELAAHTLVTSHTPEAEQRWFMTQVFGRRKPRLRLLRLPLTEAIIDVTRAGMGVGVLSEWMAGPYLARGDLVARRLVSGPLRRPWRMAWRREVAAAAARLHAALELASPRPLAASAV